MRANVAMNKERNNRWQLSAGDARARHAELLEMLEDITRLTSDWVWSLSRDFKLTFISDRIFDSCGIPPEQVIGRKLSDIGRFRTPSGTSFVPDLRRPFRDIAFEIADREGGIRHLLFSGLPVFVPETGAFSGVRGIARDVTDHVEAEKASRQLVAAIEEISEPFCLYDADGRLVVCNRRYREVNGDLADLIGPDMTFTDFVQGVVEHGLVPEAVGREAKWIEDRLNSHYQQRAPFEMRRQNGSCFLVHEQHLADGSIVMFAVDISSHKDVEHALRESAKRRQEFVADVAHQLRTPLAVLSMNLDSMDDPALASPLKGDVDALSRVVEGLLAETKVEELEIAAGDRADLTLIARSVAAYLGPLAIKMKRPVEVVAPDREVWVWGRTQALEQAIRVLVENAIDQSPDLTVVTIKVTEEPAIFVTDHGAGIRDAAKDRLFTLGLRADQRGEAGRHGLTAVRRIADAHGAEVGVFDGDGGGSVFFMRFPS